MQVQLFGSIEIELGERRLEARSFGGRKPKQLLEILLLRRGHPVSADELARLLWPGEASVGDAGVDRRAGRRPACATP